MKLKIKNRGFQLPTSIRTTRSISDLCFIQHVRLLISIISECERAQQGVPKL